MKDLITTIGAITILMIFVLQFCTNQVTMTRVVVANKLLNAFESEAEHNKLDDLKGQLSKCFGCNSSEILIDEKDNTYVIKAPLKNIVASGKFLGISDKDNEGVYLGVIEKR